MRPSLGIPLARRAVELTRDVAGDEHPDALGAEDTLGTVLLQAGRAAEAEALFGNLVKTAVRVLGEDHWGLPYILAHHGMCLVELGQYEQAEPLLLKAYPRLPPLPNADAEDTIGYLVKLYDALGKPEQAAEWRAKLPTEQDGG